LSYVDTSVIVAALDPRDPRRGKTLKILGDSRPKIISELTIVELASVLARRREVIAALADRLGIDEHLAFIAVLIYILRRFRLKYISVKEYSRTMLGEHYKPMSYAVNLASKVGLKTLDLLHIAYIKAMKEQETKIHSLLTVDADFKKHEASIQDAVGVSVELLEEAE